MATPARTDTPSGRLASIDCLRGVAVLLVLVHHTFRMSFPEKSLFWIQEWIARTDPGVRGVVLFFVISGFCIHMPWARRQAAGDTDDVRFIAFWKRRLWRLYPPYFIVLTASLALILALPFVGKSGAVTPDYFPHEPQWIVYDYVAHVLMLHGFHPEFDGSGGSPAFWTLAREEYLYLLYFALLFVRTRWSAWMSTLLALAAGIGFRTLMAAVMGEHAYGFSLISSSAIVLWIQWALGMLAVEGALGLVRLPAWTRQLWLVPPWIVMAALAEVHVVTLARARPCVAATDGRDLVFDLPDPLGLGLGRVHRPARGVWQGRDDAESSRVPRPARVPVRRRLRHGVGVLPTRRATLPQHACAPARAGNSLVPPGAYPAPDDP